MLFLCLFQGFIEKEYQTESKWNETSGEIFLEQNMHGGLENPGVGRMWRPQGWGAPPPPLQGAPPASWAPCLAPGALLPPIYTYVPRNHEKNIENPSSTAATFCTREIPSWGSFRSSAGGGIYHGVLLHHHHRLTMSCE